MLISLIGAQAQSHRIRSLGETRMWSEKGILAYVGETGKLNQGVLDQLREMRPQSTRVVYFEVSGNTSLMWRAATEIPFYFPDAGLAALTRDYRTLVVLSCSKGDCRLFDTARAEVFDSIRKTGDYDFTLTYSANASMARAEIYAITPTGRPSL